MKKPNMDLILKAVGIVVAAGTLVDAIFGKGDDERIKDLERRISEFEKK